MKSTKSSIILIESESPKTFTGNFLFRNNESIILPFHSPFGKGLLLFHLPRATVYRNIQKLLDLDYVQPKSQFGDPSKSYYNITYGGEVLKFDCYDLIQIQPTISRRIEEQISVSCSSCVFTNPSRSDFCGSCGRKQ